MMLRAFQISHTTPTTRSEAGENNMKGTTTRSAPPRAGKPGATKPSPRYAIRFESNMTRFAEVATASDRAHFAVLEAAAGVVLEQIFLNLEF